MATLKPKGRSIDELRRLIVDGLRTQYPNASWVYSRDIYPDDSLVIYTVEAKETTPSKRYSAKYQVDAQGTVSFSDVKEVQVKEVYETVGFGFEVAEFGEVVAGAVISRDAKLFQLGTYPDKDFSLDAAEADAITVPVLNSGSVHVEIEHMKNTPFSKKLGKVVKAWREGDEIFGTIEFPSALGTLLKGDKPKLSIGLDRISKKPTELSIVSNPRITDAGLLAAFGDDREEPEPERKGAVMDALKKLAEFFGKSEKETVAELQPHFGNPAKVAELEAKLSAKDAEIEALKQGQSTFTAAQSASTATQIVEGFLLKGKLTPAEKDAAVAAFSKALDADGGVQFAEGKQSYGGATSALLSAYEARPVIPQLGAGFSVVSSSTEGFKAQTPAEIYANRQGGKS